MAECIGHIFNGKVGGDWRCERCGMAYADRLNELNAPNPRTTQPEGERMARCRKHEPEWRTDNLLDQLAGKVRCKNCGMMGCYSNGQPKFGRPRRVIWFHRQSGR